MIPLQEIFAQQAQAALIRPLIVSHVSEQDQCKLLTALEASESSRSYRRQVLRILLTALESGDSTSCPTEDVITTYAGLMVPISPDESAPRSISSGGGHGESTGVRYKFNDNRIIISEDRNTLAQFGGTGYRTWEAALALGDYLINNASHLELAAGRRVLELGAGTGFAGMVAACLGADAILTDGDTKVLERLQKTLTANNSPARVCELYWSESADLAAVQRDSSLAIAADVLYDTANFLPFLAVLTKLLQNPTVEAIVATTIRNEESFAEFQVLASQAHMKLEKIAVYDPKDSPSKYFWLGPGPRIELHRIIKPVRLG